MNVDEAARYKTNRSLKHSRSTGNIKRNKPGVLKRISIEWNLFLLKLRSVSQEVFSTDDIVDEYFDSQLSEEAFDRLLRANRGYTSAEEAFIEKYRQHKSLEKMVEAEGAQIQNKSISLQDLIRSTSNDVCDDDMRYSDINVEKLRQEFDSADASDTSSNLQPSTSNIGTTLWEYRRLKWLKETHSMSVEQRLALASIDHLPQAAYVKIYTNLVEKGKLLKHDKRINLKDVIKIINAGWAAEDVWERAAKGLA
jgi:hypothetical protein